MGYYLEGNYERAIADCNACSDAIKPESKDISDLERSELLGNIYSAMNNYPKAVECFKDALRGYIEKDLVPSSLLNNYREACKGMNRR